MRVLLLLGGVADRVLPQLLVAGARRCTGQGRSLGVRVRHRRVSQAEQQVQQEREQGHLSGYFRQPRACHQLLLHPDLLREPDQEGHHQQVHPGGHDRVPQGRTRDLLYREQGRGRQDRRADPDQQAQPRTGGKGASEYQKEAVRQY